MKYFLLFVPLVAFAGADPPEYTPPNAVPLACPSGKAEWIERRGEMAEFLSTGFQPAESAIAFNKCIKENRKLFESEPALQQCFAEFIEYAGERAKTSQVPSKPKDSKKYIQDQKDYSRVPAELANREFMAMLDSGKFDEAEKYIDVLNVKRAEAGLGPLLYVRFIGNAPTLPPTKGSGRFMIYNPGTPGKRPNTEQWINFAAKETPVSSSDPAAREFYQVSVVSTHTDARGNVASYFSDHKKTYKDGNATLVHNFEKSGRGSFNCLECHRSGGPIAIHPTKPVDPKYRRALQEINATIANQGITLSQHYDENAVNKGDMWFRAENLSKNTILECFEPNVKDTTSNASIERVRGALNCTDCHDGQTRGRLNRQNVRNWVETGNMPPGAELSKDERMAVANCAERAGSYTAKNDYLEESLKNSPCSLLRGRSAPRERQNPGQDTH